jgi:hypothetical protein
VPGEREVLNPEYTAEFRQELGLLIAEALGVKPGYADMKSAELYRLPLRGVAAAIGYNMALPPRLAAAIAVGCESLRVRAEFSRWPPWVAWLWRRRLREHDRLKAQAGLVLAQYEDGDVIARFVDLMTHALYGTALAPGTAEYFRAAASGLSRPAD